MRLGALTASTAGAVNGTMTIPASTEVGAHTIVLDGTNALNATATGSSPLNVVQVFGVTATSDAATSATTASSLPHTGADVTELRGHRSPARAARLLLLIGRRRHAR